MEPSATHVFESSVRGMSCEHCVRAARAALEQLPGVTALEVSVGRVRLTATRPLRRDEIDGALAEEGFRLDE